MTKSKCARRRPAVGARRLVATLVGATLVAVASAGVGTASTVRPHYYFGVGATVYNDTAGGVGIGHWWSTPTYYDAVLAPGHWSDDYWQDNQKVYVGPGWGYGLYHESYRGGVLVWVPVSAGRGPVDLHLTSWMRYKIRTWR